jgi:NAD(P)-dependent dehydrogenase (short-subunit alcohol dehydrogenase family)
MGRLEGKVAVITGGAGGFGGAAAKLFVAEGASVLAVDRDAAGLAKLEVGIASDRFSTFTADITDAAEVDAYTAAAAERFGGLDVALLNAGITGPNTPLETYPLEAFDRVLAINLRAVWLGLRAAIPYMKRRGGGSVVVTSSIQGLNAMPGTTGYTTTKHAVVGMMKGAALELAAHKIRVNTINPGFGDTPMMHRIHEAAAPDDPAAIEAVLSQTVPMRRYAKAEEVARLMLFLASDASSYCTGAAYPIDGGTLASWGPTPH